MTTGRLLDDEMLERFRRVMPVKDMLNKKYGRDTVRLAGANPKGTWRTKAAIRCRGRQLCRRQGGEIGDKWSVTYGLHLPKLSAMNI